MYMIQEPQNRLYIQFREDIVYITKRVLKNYKKIVLNFQTLAVLSGFLCLNKFAITKLRTFLVVSESTYC